MTYQNSITTIGRETNDHKNRNQNYTINEFYIKVKGDYGKEKTVRVNDMGDKLLSLITDLGWEYQRMSRSGKEVFDEIHQLLGTITENEVYMEI